MILIYLSKDFLGISMNKRHLYQKLLTINLLGFLLMLVACTTPKKNENLTNTVQTQKPQIIKTVVTTKQPQKERPITNTKKVEAYCNKVDRYFTKYKWGKSNCEKYKWHHVRSSFLGTPIVWYVFGDEKRLKTEKNLNVTLLLCGVHGDEITPVKFCFDMLTDLRTNPSIVKDNIVVVAPIVTPDSFFKKYPTRTNARGVDVNRNFPTKDWKKNALNLWAKRYSKDKRRYPGKKALSEQETIFQVNLIKLYKPNKVISIHAPLTLLDYDGPEEGQKNGLLAKQLLLQMSKKAGKYKITNYPFFTGSLGNWAGNERNIPVYTVELPNSDWNKTKRYFKMFRSAIHFAIDHDLTDKEEKKKITKKETPPINVL